MNTYKNFLKTVAVCSLPFVALSANAGEGSDYGLKGWSKAAGKAVSVQMNKPFVGSHTGSGSGLAMYQVTVDRDGDVISAQQIRKPNDMSIRTAAKRALKKVDFPDLPASYNQEKLTFVLQLSYAATEEQAQRFQRQGYVTSKQLAENGKILRIVAQNLR